MTFHLRRTDENAADIEWAARHLGERVGLDHVTQHLNRQGVRARVPGKAVDWGFRWNEADASNTRWWPQGITTSADAQDSDDGHRLVLTSWYAKDRRGANQGSRISVVDLDTLGYRHVLLVVPERTYPSGAVVLRPLRAHAGGLVWYGPYLHVAGTRRGLFSCRVDDVMRVGSTDDAHGYRYVLPVRFAYDARAEDGTEAMRYSFLSLDRRPGPGGTPPELVAGEYGSGDMTRRLLRLPLDPSTHHLAAHEDGTSRPLWLDERGLGHMQGAAVVDGSYYVTTSRGPRRRGQLHVGRPGSWRAFAGAVPPGPEDITYWPSTDTFWSLSEHPGQRYVFAVPRSGLT